MVDLRMSHSTCSAAVNRLMRLGWVYDAGVRTKTRAGRTAIVWMPQDPPIPLREQMPTRMELARRIKRAIEAANFGADMDYIISILNGDKA
jgi:hypothetical protein